MPDPIDYNSRLLLLGSCFVENMGEKFAHFKFRALQNPFGILFHPKAIENLVVNAIGNKQCSDKDVFFFNERWHCFDAHSALSDISKEALLQKLNDGLAHTAKQLLQASHIIITLGTAWVYRNRTTGAVVANCHKVPQAEFSNEILEVDAIAACLENIIAQIKSVNKNCRLIFTISPVRHLKDGFVENQRSKAHLITALHNVCSQDQTSYFPSYEIMMDELRDYRFYNEDMVHPNALAINYIWEKFREVCLSDSTAAIMKKVDAVQKGLQHRPFNPKAEKHLEFLKTLEQKIQQLQSDHSFMKF